jgi:hypothetical protein
MRSLRFLNLLLLSVLVGSATLMFAQDEKPQDKPAQQEEAKPQPKQDEAKPARSQDAQPSKEEPKDDKRAQEPAHEDHPMPADHAREGQDHPVQQQAHAQPAGKGGHIPDDKFRANFGRSHTFTAQTVIVSGQPQFRYGGYSFELVDVWPVRLGLHRHVLYRLYRWGVLPLRSAPPRCSHRRFRGHVTEEMTVGQGFMDETHSQGA